MKVQTVIPSQTCTTEVFSSCLTELCKAMSCENILFYNKEGLTEDNPLIVVCQACSRSETDIDSAILGIKWTRRFVVLFLHSCLENSLPRIPTASKLGKMNKYQNIEFIDFAFNMENKLYSCQMNVDARRQLQNFISRFYGMQLASGARNFNVINTKRYLYNTGRECTRSLFFNGLQLVHHNFGSFRVLLVAVVANIGYDMYKFSPLSVNIVGRYLCNKIFYCNVPVSFGGLEDDCYQCLTKIK